MTLKIFRTSFDFECKAKTKEEAIQKWMDSEDFHYVYENLAHNMREVEK